VRGGKDRKAKKKKGAGERRMYLIQVAYEVVDIVHSDRRRESRTEKKGRGGNAAIIELQRRKE
jgi:hypothetical protein